MAFVPAGIGTRARDPGQARLALALHLPRAAQLFIGRVGRRGSGPGRHSSGRTGNPLYHPASTLQRRRAPPDTLLNRLFERSNTSRSCSRLGAKMGSHPAKSRQESGGVWTVICPGKQHFANLLDSPSRSRPTSHRGGQPILTRATPWRQVEYALVGRRPTGERYVSQGLNPQVTNAGDIESCLSDIRAGRPSRGVAVAPSPDLPRHLHAAETLRLQRRDL